MISMKQSKVWLVTGAGSGIGLEIAKSALAAGHKVVATGRNTDKISRSIGNLSGNLLIIKMDVTDL
jgi:NADP-dependent 3-hydroxy acid dehydrogenase YdfG